MKKFLLSIFAVMLAVFSVQAEEVTYKVASTSSVTVSGTAPAGSSATFKNTYTNNKEQITKNNSMTLTLKGYAGYKITGITLLMKSNKSAGTGSFSMKAGSTELSSISSSAFSNKNWNGSYTQTYTEVKPTMKNADYKIGENENVVITIAASANSLYCQSFKIEYEQVGGVVLPEQPAPVISPESCEFNAGESVFVKIEAAIEGADIYYTLDGTEPSAENGELYKGEIEITETTTVKAIAVTDGYKNSDVVEAKYTKIVVIEGGIVDVLNRAFTGVTGTDYKSWSRKAATSAAVYAGQSAGGNGAIQLRSNNSNSGIVTTVSGGKVKKISIDWNSNTDASRKLWVYGSNTAYTNPTELYNTSTDGDKLAEIPCGTIEFVIEGDYKYIGLRSASGAMYLNSVEITWVAEEKESYTLSVTDAGYATLFLDFAAAIPEDVEAYAVTAVNTGYVTLKQVEGVLPVNTGVIVKADEGNYNFVASTKTPAVVKGNFLEGTVAATEINVEAYVLWNVDGEACFCKAKMTDGVWLNNANKAYLPASAANGAASYSFRFEDGTTGISEVKGESGEVKAIFDLTGRKLKGENGNLKGIYIINGKKVLVK